MEAVPPLRESDILSLGHGVILARSIGSENEARRILQEASVIGEGVSVRDLKRVTELRITSTGTSQAGAARPDPRPVPPSGTRVCVQARLDQEVTYNGLLKKRAGKRFHRPIARVIEQLFGERLPEFYETLAYHYTQGDRVDKAVDYLMKSGRKSLSRYALEESHKSFQQAYDLLRGKSSRRGRSKVLVDLLNAWAPAFHCKPPTKTL